MAPKDPVDLHKNSPSSNSNHEGIEDERVQRLRWILNQNVPVIGGWIQSRVLSALAESALQGNPHAVTAMAQALARRDGEEDDKFLAEQTLRKINFASGIDAAWKIWAETRSPRLEVVLREKNHPAAHPASARLLSALCLGDLETVTRGSAELMLALVAACYDQAPDIRERANQCIRKLKNPSSIDMLCRIWAERREKFVADILKESGYVAQKPPRIRALSALKTSNVQALLQASAEMVAPLVDACQDEDPEIAVRAKAYLLHLNQQSAVDAFCRLWKDTRSPLLEETLLTAAYAARSPLDVRLLVALKRGQTGVAQDISPDGLQILLDATRDADETIQKEARQALEHLTQEDTRSALAMHVIQTGDPLSREIALKCGYEPSAPEQRALFLFLTEQWSAYDELDYDQSMLRALYQTASPELRARIASRVQSAGRTAYLAIMMGLDYHSRAQPVNPNEAALLVKILTENKEWEKLWRLASELALPYNLQIINTLSQNGWQPEEELDRPLFAELAALAQQPMLLGGPELARALPMALSRAGLKVTGRVNEVAFSPNATHLAIASSQRKVVIWNFQTAAVEKVFRDFKHSVGKVMYTPQGTLAAGERSNSSEPCSLFVYEKDEPYQLFNHDGSITVLEMAGPNRMLIAGRDGKLALWDLQSRKLIKEAQLSESWPRNAAVAPDGQSFAFLGQSLRLFRLPELRVIPGSPFITPRSTATNGYRKGVAHYAAFSPDGKYILAGQHNGQVALYFHNSLIQPLRRAMITEHPQPVRGIHFLPGHPLVITAGAEGQVRFIRWPEMTQAGAVFLPEGKLTSLHVSQNGDFMATGTSDASLRLWDLRVLDIPDLFAQPLATASHEQIAKVMALSEYHGLPEPVRRGLRFMKLLLQFRFRFDIQIDEAPVIQFGEFDIILEDE